MSIKVMNKVWENSQCGGTELLLLIALADWADDWGYCNPTISQMSERINQSKRNVIRLLKNLERKGEIQKIKRSLGGRGRRVGSLYRIVIDNSTQGGR